MSKLFVQQCAILSLLLTRKLFQTGSPCFPLNSKIHNLTCVTVIFSWCSQPALHILKLSLTFHALKWFLELHQRSYILSSAGCWVNKSFSCWKKKWSWGCQRDSSTFSIAPRNSLPITLVLLEPFSFSEYFCYDLLFLQETWARYWVLRLTSKYLLWSWPTYCHWVSFCS